MNELDPHRLQVGLLVYVPDLNISGYITAIKAANTSSSYIVCINDDLCVDAQLVYQEDELISENLENL